jgi:hypothetical protein
MRVLVDLIPFVALAPVCSGNCDECFQGSRNKSQRSALSQMTRVIPRRSAREIEKTTVKYRIRLLLWICVVALPSVAWAQDQDVEFSGNDNPSVTTNLGIPLSAPLAPMGDHVGFAWGVTRVLATTSTGATR